MGEGEKGAFIRDLRVAELLKAFWIHVFHKHQIFPVEEKWKEIIYFLKILTDSHIWNKCKSEHWFPVNKTFSMKVLTEGK